MLRLEDRKQVMFSDESHFELRFGNQDSLCKRRKGSDRYALQFTKKDVKHLEKVMAWGCFSWMGRGGLEFLGKGEMMNRIRYRRLLDEKLVFFLNPKPPKMYENMPKNRQIPTFVD
jgi:hypothetical protein